MKIENKFLPESDDSLPDFTVDTNVNFDIVKPYFKASTYNKFLTLVKSKSLKKLWHCGTCKEKLEDRNVQLCCDECLSWFHLSCTELSDDENLPEKWYCSGCMKPEEA